jgi:hypothetical protein
MAQRNPVLAGAIRKLAHAGEKVGFTVEEMIELLNTGVSVETLLNLICFSPEVTGEQTATATDAVNKCQQWSNNYNSNPWTANVLQEYVAMICGVSSKTLTNWRFKLRNRRRRFCCVKSRRKRGLGTL